MAIEGPLRELSLSDVFQLLDLSRKTGVLTVASDRRAAPATVRFDRGGVVSAELPGSSERIGHLLLRAGKVTEAQVAEARLAQQREPGTPLGVILVRQGAATVADVRRQLRFQVQETVYELIQWKDGYFRFEEAEPSDDSEVAIRVPTESLLMEAARRIDEWSTLEAKVPHMAVVPTLVGELAEGTMLDLQPAEWEVLAEIDGARTLKQIAAALGRSDFEVAKIAYGLVSTGVVEVREEAPPQPAAEAAAERERPLREGLAEARAAVEGGETERARRMLDDLVRAHPDHPDVHLLVAEVQRRQGRWSEALHALGRAASLDPLSAPVHYHLGFASAHTGDLARAATAWDTYLRLGDEHPQRRERALRARTAAEALRAVLDDEAAA